MYTKLVVLFFAAFPLSLSALDSRFIEQPTHFAILTELNDQGLPIESDVRYELTVNIRQGVTSHYTSFHFCTRGETRKCDLFWVVVPKESLRCDGERYVSISGWETGETDAETPSWLELVVSRTLNTSCTDEARKTHWRVRLHEEGRTDRYFEGDPRQVLLFQ